MTMTRDDVIAMAREANLPACHTTHPKALERFAKLVRDDYSNKHAALWLRRIKGAVEAEREACAQIAETPISGEQDDITMEAKDRVAKAIRARSNT